MTPQTFKLHAALIRFAKGMISAWEEWVRAQQTVVNDPDPVEHFKKQ